MWQGWDFFCKRHERGKQAIYFEGKLVKWFAGERLSRRKTAQGLLLHLTVYALAVVCGEDFFVRWSIVSYSSLNSPTKQGPTRAHPSAEKSANTVRSGRARQRSAVRSHPLQRPLLRYPECGSDSGRAGWGEASQRSQRRVWSLGVSWRNDFPFSPGANCTMTTSHLPSRCLFSEKKKE